MHHRKPHPTSLPWESGPRQLVRQPHCTLWLESRSDHLTSAKAFFHGQRIESIQSFTGGQTNHYRKDKIQRCKNMNFSMKWSRHIIGIELFQEPFSPSPHNLYPFFYRGIYRDEGLYHKPNLWIMHAKDQLEACKAPLEGITGIIY